MAGPLVSAAWLREHLGDAGVRVVDCRFRLGEPGVAEKLYREGHIPGATFIDVDRDLAAPPGERGRHPLPDADAFEAAARRAGIGPRQLVVACDEAAEGGAARLWWLLRHFGHGEVVVLDGGLRGWRAEGGELRGGEERVEPGDFEVAPPPANDTTRSEELGLGVLPGHMARESAQPPGASAQPPGVGEAGPGSVLLLDARTSERYRGELEPIDPVAGRIPGARNLPFAELAPEGRFLPPQDLRARFEALGVEQAGDAVAYCGSGITACVLVLAAEIAGVEPVRLYPGSWSEWSGRGLPVERG